MKVFSQKKPFLFGLGVSLATMVLLGAVSVALMTAFSDLNSITIIAVTSATQLVLSIVVILIARHICIVKGWFGAKGTGKGLLLGWLCYVLAGGMFVVNVIGTSAEYWAVPRLWPLFMVVSIALTTGLFEEVLVRGLVLNVMLNKKGGARKNILIACWISSALFGALHMLNVIVGAGIIETIGQVIYATFMGMFFSALYIRTRSLWAPIILHALVDLPSFSMYALLSEQGFQAMAQQESALSTQDTIVSSSISVAVCLPFLFAALIMLRRKKIGTEKEVCSIPAGATQ